MAIEQINLGTVVQDGADGDVARVAFTKVNENFEDLDTRVTALENFDVGTVTSVNDVQPIGGNVELSPSDIGAATAAQGALADTAIQPSIFTAALDQKVDKVAGFQLSQENFTTALKDKLEGLGDSGFKGIYPTLVALEAAIPVGEDGDWAIIDASELVSPRIAIWSESTTEWQERPGGSGGGGSMTPSEIKVAYESNPDTNAFTDAEKSKLTGIEAGAQVNTVTSVAGKTGAVSLVKADVGLSNVDNTSDLNKPVSTATQTALDGKQDTLVSATNIKTVNGQTLLGSGDLTVEGGGGAPLFSVMWWPQRSAIPDGYVAADGQALSRATYPDAWAGIRVGNVPTVADATWNSTPTERGKFTVGDGSTTFRLPDYNGKFAGSLGAVFLRGDGALSAAISGAIQQDAMQRITGAITYNDGILPVGTEGAMSFQGGHFSPGRRAENTTASAGVFTAAMVFDSANSPDARTATETRPLSVTGVWVIKLFGAVVNVGSADAAQLASDYANLAGQVTALQGSKLDVTDKRVCTAWATIQGTGTVTLLDSFNVSSVVDNGNGNYTLNFEAPMDSTNYCISGSVGSSVAHSNFIFGQAAGSTRTVNAVGVVVTNGGSTTLVDQPYVQVNVFGGKA